MKELLTITDLNAGYGKVIVLRDVNLRVSEGEIVAVIGPNGAGKSTLLKNISGLVHPTSGKIVFKGQDITGQPAYKAAGAGISFVQEGGRPFPNMTVYENLRIGAFHNREILKSNILDEVFELFPILKERQKQYARTLSGGQKQMLAIGRGLTSRPSLLMLDEPSLGLAPNLVKEIYGKLQKLRDFGLTVLLVEQDTAHALRLADRAYVLENGVVRMEGSGSELARSEHIKTHYLGL
jgi:branched-chain amino acid transport system ATP-binding protein